MSADKFRALVRELHSLKEELREELKIQEGAERAAAKLNAQISEINEKAKAATNYHGKVIIVDSRCFQVTSSGFRELDELT